MEPTGEAEEREAMQGTAGDSQWWTGGEGGRLQLPTVGDTVTTEKGVERLP